MCFMRSVEKSNQPNAKYVTNKCIHFKIFGIFRFKHFAIK